MTQILPSIFGADILNLQNEIDFLEEEDTKILHVDMMDGNFVSNIAFGPNQIKAMKAASVMTFDIHMMLAHPEEHLQATLDTGAEMLSVHYESTPHIHWILQQIRKAGRKAGIVLNPGTPENVLKYLLDDIDYVLVMSINPGRPGQSFLPGTIEKIKNVKQMIGNRPIQIEVDGGIDDKHAKDAKMVGTDLLVVGGFLFSDDPHAQYAKLNAAIK
ncbi:ribulose-phosphate 3-epimerase [Lactiplantibacillus plantarum]|uniref:ribulose-phosphate 3-epimerase n=1 Tax=Lactiplantibacillus plantarum TaxID=1590 RepID=UPI00209DB613|nr:ribulose-phosphate 3-epimerase [Lactiplantibacillus plantarum]USZ60682.1 ribulose-phosphate 3-epimerase [Lactiplantibacillus plantarum]